MKATPWAYAITQAARAAEHLRARRRLRRVVRSSYMQRPAMPEPPPDRQAEARMTRVIERSRMKNLLGGVFD
ncbi:MAG: hypothetical protein Q8R92_10040 [Deltaproteobacteria bacterium]|nr:hypothetical protein [Deltaproteobacteria bacterium]